MPTLLLEIGCEELPASACREAEERLRESCRTFLGVSLAITVFAGPRRVAAVVENVPERTAEAFERGPPVSVAFDERGRPTKAAEGFARKGGVRVEDLQRRGDFVGVVVPGLSLRELLPNQLAKIVLTLSLAKSMRWGPELLRFPRPIRWLCAKLDSETIPVALEDVPSGGVSFGHRFRAGQIEIPDASTYLEVLRGTGVEPDPAERRRVIVEALDAIGGWSDPGSVLEEVVYLVESPAVLQGSFDERFLELPERVIQTAMQSHQRYFPLGGARFAFVANGGDPDIVRAGNERVLEGRLEDASFTFERDLALGIESLARKLSSITFVAGVGSFADKTARLERLVELLGGGDASREAARLAKADQAAELVREFPDLEGVIGAEYARVAGYPEGVCSAIEEQYLPDAAGGPLPQTEAGRVLAAADKIDTLTVAIALNQRPTGSRDPYGLRRAAIGLCRLAIECRLEIDLRALVMADVELLVEQGAAIAERDPDAIVRDVTEFVEERLEALLDVPVEFVRVARGSLVPRLGRKAELAQTLAALDDERLERLHTVYTRADRIVTKSPDKDLGDLRPELLTEPAEKDVFGRRDEVWTALATAQDFDEAVSAVEQLAEPLERFFDQVLVMTDDEPLRRNRLRLLYDLRDLIGNSLGDLSQIPR